MKKEIKYPKMQIAAQRRAAKRSKDSLGKFSKAEQNIAVDSQPSDIHAVTPPVPNVQYESMFNANSAPVSGILYNPDQAFIADQDNASRMLNDLTIWSAFQERLTATVMLPFSIAPQDEDDPEQQNAADEIEDIIRSHLPDVLDFFRCLNFAIWVGRSACYMNYKWDFSTGKKRMIPTSWTPVHGDTLVFGTEGQLGYRVANFPNTTPSTQYSVEGRYVPVGQPDEPDALGNSMLSPREREAWVVHHFNRTPGEYRLFRSAAAKEGIGLRSTLYNTWMLKINLLQFIMQSAEKFGSGWLLGYFNMSNPKSAAAMGQALQSQIGSTTMLIPRSSGEEAIEGIEVLNPPQGMGDLIKMLEYYNSQIRVSICGQNLTAESAATGLGSNLADQHANTFDRLIKYDSQILAETVSKDLVAVLQAYNGFGHLPPLKLVFSLDTDSADQKIDRALKLYTMGVRISMDELVKSAGFTMPKASEESTDPEEDIKEGESVGVRSSVH